MRYSHSAMIPCGVGPMRLMGQMSNQVLQLNQDINTIEGTSLHTISINGSGGIKSSEKDKKW